MADEPLGRMVIELGLDHSDFGKGLTGAKNEVKYAMADMKSSMAVVGQSGKQFDILAAKAKGLTTVMSSQQRVVQELGKAYNNSFADGKATAQTGKLATQLQNANAKMMALATQYKNNAAAMAKYRVENTGFTGGLNKMSKAAVSTGTAMSNIGSKMTRGVTTPIVAGLAYATKSAVQFDSQIKSIGPLLTNGAAVTGRFKDQLDAMASSSKKWSTQYGISTTEINNGMSELVRRGFTANQTLGSMPAILDAAKASGEDLGTVLNTTSAIVDQFGLRTKSTSGTLKNTQMVTDSLTYAANATAAGFGDMGEAMSYVGPQAKAAGLSVQQTAAAIGELSNKNIEGSKAGTALRGILTSLVKVSPNAAKGFRSMGISAAELKKDSSDLPRLIDDITKGTKGWSKADRNKALALEFGRENQGAMNALLETGSAKLRELTKATEESTGVTKKQAAILNQTSAAKVQQLVQSLHVLGIEIGAKVVPALIPLVDQATKMVDGFGDLDDGTQRTIVKFGLLVAAAGPVLSILGKITSGFGVVGGGIVNVVSKFSQMQARSNASKEALTLLQDGAKGLGEEFKYMQGSATTGAEALKGVNSTVGNINGTVATAKTGLNLFGTALTTTEAGAGVLGTTLTVAGAALTGVGVAAVAGVAYWELYGKKASESAQRVSEWGSDIGKTASDAATDMSSFETKASTALDGFNTNAKKSAKEVNQAFKDMVDSASKNVDKRYKDASKLADSIGGDAAAALMKQADKEKEANEKRIQDMASTAQKVNDITSKSAKDGVKLTADQAADIVNLQRKMAEDEIDTLQLKSSQKKSVLAAELGETKSMTEKQLAETAKDIGDAAYKEANTYNTKYGKIAQAEKDGLITAKEAAVAEEQLQKSHNATMTQLGEDLIRTEKQQGKSRSDIISDLENNGFTSKQAEAAMNAYTSSLKQTAATAIKITGDMSKSVRSAAESWNKMVLDPKTGKLKTNAQEEINKAVKNKDQWNQMKLLLKEGKMSSNAAAMVGIASVNAKKWDKLSLKEKQAMIRSKGGDDLAGLIEKGKQWSKFTPAEKKAIINAKGGPELLKVLNDTKTWNKLTTPEKKIALKDNASPAMKSAKMNLTDWNHLTPKMKTVVANAKGASDVAKGVKSVKDWNSLPTKEKTLIANDKNARGIIKGVTGDYKKYINLPKDSVKNLVANDKATKPAVGAKISVDKFGNVKIKPIPLKANDGATKPAKTAKKSLEQFNGTKMTTKTARGNDGASVPVGTAKDSLSQFNSVAMIPKTANGIDHTTGPMTTAKSSAGQFNGLKMITKYATGIDHASGPVNKAIGVMNAFSALGNITRTVTTIFRKITGHAMGTNATDGNPIMVNDQEGPVFREAIKYPGKTAFIPHGRNVILEDAPRGTQVIPANLTARMFNIPQYAKGTISPNSSVIQASKVINESTQVPTFVPRPAEQSDNKSLKDLTNQVGKMVELLGTLTGFNAAQLQAIKDQGTFDTKGLYKRQAKDLSMHDWGLN